LRESDRPDDVDASRKAGDSWWEESCEREIGRGRSFEGIMVWPRCHASTPQGPRTRTQAEPTPHGRTVLARTSSVLPWQELVHQPSRFVRVQWFDIHGEYSDLVVGSQTAWCPIVKNSDSRYR